MMVVTHGWTDSCWAGIFARNIYFLCKSVIPVESYSSSRYQAYVPEAHFYYFPIVIFHQHLTQLTPFWF